MKTLLILMISALSAILSAEPAIHINQIGYECSFPKSAVVDIPAEAEIPRVFELIRTADGSTVYSGTIGGEWTGMDWSDSRIFARIDFTSFQTAGIYQIRVRSDETILSYPFEIGKSLLLKRSFPLVLGSITRSRNNGTLYMSDKAVPVFDGTDNPAKTVDVSGGWYDASGDISKYLSHLQYTNFMTPQQSPFAVWEMAHILEKYPAAAELTGTGEALRREAAYGADFLVRMKADNAYFYSAVFDGWSGIPDFRTVCAYSGPAGEKNSAYQTAFREGGGMAAAALALCARLGLSGEFSSQEYLDAAVSAYEHLKINNTLYCDDGKENAIDDYCALIAAVELARTLKSDTYLQDARARAVSLMNRQHPEGWFYADDGTRPFYHAVEYGLLGTALALYGELDSLTDQSRTFSAVNRCIQHTEEISRADNPFGLARELFLYEGELRSRFFMPRTNESGYWWQGENARLASTAVLAAADHQKDSAALRLAVDQLDWILGKNPYGFCMVQGVGSKNNPPYGYEKFGHTDFDGGICNGIHSGADGGDSIDFITGDRVDIWRSSEQWIPHAAWYMLAAAVLAERSADTVKTAVPAVFFSPEELVTASLYTLSGRKVREFTVGEYQHMSTRISSADIASGIYVIRILNLKGAAVTRVYRFGSGKSE